ncbi:hypothetical protein B0H15DRAFT_949501 [Mycena belliarum]|uniref:Uncharacterized protein n=1 Tax=Mycena belliarum TaxID=1033014 RepID=A0AAD6U5W7_9AGAR|nr:hypothetical protein B0H15DRAFT_949501 [Mycena belliae]
MDHCRLRPVSMIEVDEDPVMRLTVALPSDCQYVLMDVDDPLCPVDPAICSPDPALRWAGPSTDTVSGFADSRDPSATQDPNAYNRSSPLGTDLPQSCDLSPDDLRNPRDPLEVPHLLYTHNPTVLPSTVHRTISDYPPQFIFSQSIMSPAHISAAELNTRFDFIGSDNGDVQNLPGSDTVAVTCDQISAVVNTYLHFTSVNVAELFGRHFPPSALPSHMGTTETNLRKAALESHDRKRSAAVPPSASAPVLNLIFSNDHGQQVDDAVRLFTLNKYFELEHCAPIDEMKTSDIARFLQMYLPIGVGNLRILATMHGLPFMHRRPNLLSALMQHECNDACPITGLLFKQLESARPGPFLLRAVPTSVPDTAPTLQSLDDLHVLPLTLSNEIIVDPEDGETFVSTYKLNRVCDFVGIATKDTV